MTTYPDLFLYINGEWRKTASDLPVLNPATEEEIGRLPCAQKSDLDDAIESATRGFELWSQVPPSQRAKILYKWQAINALPPALRDAALVEDLTPFPKRKVFLDLGDDE